MKHVLKGFLIAVGAGLATVLVWMLLLLLSPIKRWLFHEEDSLSPSGRTVLTIFLVVLCLVLLGLLIVERISYSRFRMRVYEKKVTDKELEPEMMKKVMSEVIAAQKKYPRPPWSKR